MGNIPFNINKKENIINYEYIQKNFGSAILISTLDKNDCLIKETLNPEQEVEYINNCIKNNFQKNIIVYGKNYMDKTIYDQYKKLNSLGFDNIYIYPGGIFEWLLLQEVFGKELFPTTIDSNDILKYKSKNLNI